MLFYSSHPHRNWLWIGFWLRKKSPVQPYSWLNQAWFDISLLTTYLTYRTIGAGKLNENLSRAANSFIVRRAPVPSGRIINNPFLMRDDRSLFSQRLQARLPPMLMERTTTCIEPMPFRRTSLKWIPFLRSEIDSLPGGRRNAYLHYNNRSTLLSRLLTLPTWRARIKDWAPTIKKGSNPLSLIRMWASKAPSFCFQPTILHIPFCGRTNPCSLLVRSRFLA